MEVILVYPDRYVDMGFSVPWRAYPAETTRNKQIETDVENEFGPGAGFVKFGIVVENT